MSNRWPEVVHCANENRHELNLNGHDVSQRIEKSGLDHAVFELVNINFLNISETCLESIPDEIGKLVNLQSLLLHSNQLTEVAGNIDSLLKLKLLDMSRNCISKIVADFNKLTQLTSLNLSSNRIDSFPSLGSQSKITVLDLSNNDLSEFPDIVQATHLYEVKLTKNLITCIPAAIGGLACLKCFDIASNQIRIVPAELSDIGKLKEVNLKGNPVADKRLLKLIEQCKPKQVLDYVRQHCPRSAVQGAAADDDAAKGGGKRGGGKRAGRSAASEVPAAAYRYRITVMRDGALAVPSVSRSELVKSVRPFVALCAVSELAFDGDSFRRFIQMQTRLHETVCDKRNRATIATHDLAKLPASGGLTYTAMSPRDLLIQPLGKVRPSSGAELYARLEAEAKQLKKEKKRNTYSGIHRYLYLLEGKPLYPCLVDSEGRTVSFPPITNSDVTKMSQETRSMLAEVTSNVSLDVCKRVLDQLLLEMLCLGVTAVPDSLDVHRVYVVDGDGPTKVFYPTRADLTYEETQAIQIVYQ